MSNLNEIENTIEKLSQECAGLNDNHEDVDNKLNELCGLLESAGRADEAVYFYKRILKIRLKKYGDGHEMTAHCANNIAGAYVQTGNFEIAERYMKRALDIYVQSLGKEHETTALAAKNLLFLQSVLNKEEGDEIIL